MVNLLETTALTKHFGETHAVDKVDFSIRDGEVLSLIGDVARDSADAPTVHAHVVVGLSDGTARGGHLLAGRVWPTLEVILVESPSYLRKRYDAETGLALIDPAA